MSAGGVHTVTRVHATAGSTVWMDWRRTDALPDHLGSQRAVALVGGEDPAVVVVQHAAGAHVVGFLSVEYAAVFVRVAAAAC